MNLAIDQMKVYFWLCEHEERPSLKEIGERLGMLPMQVTRAIKVLEDFGVISCERGGGMKNPIVPETIKVEMPPEELRKEIVAGVLAELRLAGEEK